MSSLTSIDGLNSGLDTTAIVDAMIASERRNAVLLEQQQAEKTNIISTLKAFQARLLGLASSVKQLTRTSTFEKGTVEISDESYLSATATGRVATGSYQVQVQSLARNHQIASQGFTDQSSSSFGTGAISIGVGDGSLTTVTIDSSNNSLLGIKNAINDSNAAVTATIINDGSGSNPYRLILTADKTGQTNEINMTSTLSGADTLNFDTATFDAPELLRTGSGSSSEISLGASASYTGDENKIYTFTVAGTGSQTIGSDNVTINWTDGTNSGAIVVTQADSEVELVGTGADGLRLSLSAGTLTGGDTFQVSTFAPLLQQASDARLAIGSSGGSGSPIVVTSETNTFNDVIGGVQLTLDKETDAGDYVTIKTDVDLAAIKTAINEFITQFNSVSEFVDDQNSYNADTGESGYLFGDYTLQSMQASLRYTMGSKVRGLTTEYSQLASVGIRTGADGGLAIRDSAMLEEALRDHLDEVVKLFADSGTSSTNYIEFMSSSAQTDISDSFDVDITQVATHGVFTGDLAASPESLPLILTSANNRLRLRVDGMLSDEIILDQRTYETVDELINEIQAKIDADSKIGGKGVSVEWVTSDADTGYISLASSSYGSGSRISMETSVANSAFAVLGLASGTSVEGLDVAGTINGEAATGAGQFLVGDAENDTTAGLRLKILLDESQMAEGVDGTISVAKGVASQLYDRLDSYTKSGDGMMDRRIKGYENQVSDLAERVAFYDERLALRRERLMQQFYQMESILGQLGAQNTYLTNQLLSINANWAAGKN